MDQDLGFRLRVLKFLGAPYKGSVVKPVGY